LEIGKFNPKYESRKHILETIFVLKVF